MALMDAVYRGATATQLATGFCLLRYRDEHCFSALPGPSRPVFMC